MIEWIGAQPAELRELDGANLVADDWKYMEFIERGIWIESVAPKKWHAKRTFNSAAFPLANGFALFPWGQ